MLALVTNFFKGTLLINGSLSSNQLGGKGEKRQTRIIQIHKELCKNCGNQENDEKVYCR